MLRLCSSLLEAGKRKLEARPAFFQVSEELPPDPGSWSLDLLPPSHGWAKVCCLPPAESTRPSSLLPPVGIKSRLSQNPRREDPLECIEHEKEEALFPQARDKIVLPGGIPYQPGPEPRMLCLQAIQCQPQALHVQPRA